MNIFFGDDGSSMKFDDLKFWNLDEMSLFVPTATPAFEGSSTFTNIQAYISQQSPTFEDDFSSPDMVWGGTDEGAAIYAMVSNDALKITDHAAGGGTDPGSVQGVLFPVNGLLDASDFALQVKFQFEGLSKVGLQFKSTAKMNTGYRFVFTPGSWDLFYSNTWITGGWWTLSTDFHEALLIVKGDFVALFMNNKLIYEGTLPTSADKGNQIIASGIHGSFGYFEVVKFWNLEGTTTESLASTPTTTGTSPTEPILAFLSSQSPTFEENFEPIKFGWGNNSELLGIYSFVKDGRLDIEDSIVPDAGENPYGPDYRIPGVSFPINGLFDAYDFSLQFNFRFDTLAEVRVQFRSTYKLDTGFRLTFFSGNQWDLKIIPGWNRDRQREYPMA